ncbi:similar to Saccharomyces cerevisiae YOL119C MCH4 Protein with similarity to mammalian monocarboxylate permeases [Maudiozyma saulgeensis]|uniref:Similar to Saccharomyces cerevisiae YOL119C MCH4 Protein with similarity to mammalian monocarboxylate permeases n=1 Tax=Maudiozyma saulgeensis TaxID=1789683 RepID=A0A1X7RAH1_9SACH|nr:similar to Saccharomyces cerevisiae YOL119C MCH4 Protein with similarity to mammalian monocarboxylate permeases [Kazachstania saulgeensis]
MLPMNFLSRPANVFFSKGHGSKKDAAPVTPIPSIIGLNDHTTHSEIEMESLNQFLNQTSGFTAETTTIKHAGLTAKNGEFPDDVAFDATIKTIEPELITDNEDTSIFEDENGRTYPEGGLDAWLVVLGSFVGLIPIFGMVNSLGAIESYVSKHQLAGVAQSTISWIFSLYLVITFLSCVLTGGYFDRNGSFKPMCFGILFYEAGLIALADCQEVYQFILAFSVLCGMGSGFLMTPLVSVIATWFYRKRGVATSVATMGGSIGGMIIAPILRKLYVEVGFKWALRIFALICAVCLIISLCLVKVWDQPTAIPFTSRWDEFKWYFSSSFNWRYFLEGPFLFAALGAALAESALTALATYVSSYSLSVGNSESTSYNLITVTNAAGMLGRYIPGYVADKYLGGFNVTIITVSMAVLVNFIIWLPFGTNLKALWTYSALYGFSTGSILSLTPVCVGQISRTDDFGKRYSTVYMLEALLTIPVLPIGGAIIGNGSISNYNNFIIFNSVVMLVGAICYFISRWFSVGFKLVKY